MTRVQGLTILVLGALWMSGCCKGGKSLSGLGDPKVGDPCTPGKAACLDKRTELVCEDGKYVASACKGLKGCSVVGDKQSCDVSGNVAGDPCPTASDGDAQCTTDRHRMVVCHEGKYVVLQCRGPKSCNDSGPKVQCDRDVQLEGDPCLIDEDHRCTLDKKKKIACKSGRYVMDGWCRGPGGCDASGEKVTCDRGPQNVGEMCDKPEDHECAMDGKTILTCRGAKWVVDKKCPRACKSTTDTVGCG